MCKKFAAAAALLAWHAWQALSGIGSATALAGETDEIAPPVVLQVQGKPLDVQTTGHAAPFVGDFDGDGRKDLLVGQFEEGKLRLYRNVGSNSQPRFEDFTWFQAGGTAGKVPAG